MVCQIFNKVSSKNRINLWSLEWSISFWFRGIPGFPSAGSTIWLSPRRFVYDEWHLVRRWKRFPELHKFHNPGQWYRTGHPVPGNMISQNAGQKPWHFPHCPEWIFLSRLEAVPMNFVFGGMLQGRGLRFGIQRTRMPRNWGWQESLLHLNEFVGFHRVV